jgi:hypothetical protein
MINLGDWERALTGRQEFLPENTPIFMRLGDALYEFEKVQCIGAKTDDPAILLVLKWPPYLRKETEHPIAKAMSGNPTVTNGVLELDTE